MVRRWLEIGVASAALVVGGCHHLGHRPCAGSPSLDRTRDRDTLDPPDGVIRPRGGIPSTDLPTTPPGGPPPAPEFTPRRDTYSPGPLPRLEEPVLPADPGALPPERSRSNKETILPETKPDLLKPPGFDPQSNGARPVPGRDVLLDPVESVDGVAVAPKKETLLPAPVVNEDRVQRSSGSSPLTDRPAADLPDFALVPGKTNVANGRKPPVEGLDRLKDRGFRTLAYLHDPKTDVAAAKELAEKHGLKFVAIPVAADGVKAAATKFDELVTDAAVRPLYVCDDDGTRTGALWYAHFRTSDLTGEDTARVRATRLGLKDPAAAEQKPLWDAVQDYLANR